MKAAEQHQVNFADCYVLVNKRTRTFVGFFLNTFLPRRQEVAKQYDIPQFAEHPESTFYSAAELLDYLEQHQNETHAIYWLNTEVSTLRGAMCIFTSDGQVILGLYCETRRPETAIETTYLERLMKFCDSTSGIIEYEQPAPQDTAAFLERLKEKSQPGTS